MDNSLRYFILTALLLIFVSSSAGVIYAFSVEHETLLKLREQYESAFSAAAVNNLKDAGSSLRQAEKLNYRYVRMIDAHTHIIKLATLLLVFSLLISNYASHSKIQGRITTTMTAGSILFPAGVLMQVYAAGFLFNVVAATGALLIIGSMFVLVYLLFRETDT